MSVHDDREAIKELKALYARCADAVFNQPGPPSALAMANLFTDDGSLELGSFGHFAGRQSLITAFESTLPAATAWSMHYILSPILEINGTEASGSWYFLIYYVPNGDTGSKPAQLYGSYSDKYKKINGVWRIQASTAHFVTPPGA